MSDLWVLYDGDSTFGTCKAVSDDAGAITLTVDAATLASTLQINDNASLQFEGIADDTDGLTIACDSSGDATINATAGNLTLTTSDAAITTASGLTLSGSVATALAVTGTVQKGIDVTDATLTQGWNNAFFACGSGNGTDGDQHTMAVTDFYIPLQVNIASTAGPAAPSEVGAAMFRADAITADQPYTSLDVLMLRSKVDKRVYAASCINASQTISSNISVLTGAVQTVFIQMNGAGTITSPNDVNVLEVKYAQTSGGGGVNNVAQLYCIATGCTIDNVLDIVNGAGTVTNAVLVRGTYTAGIAVTGTMAKGIDFTDATLTQGWNNAFFACGSGNGSTGDQHTAAVTDFYIPIQVNIASTAGPSAPSEVGAAMLRADAITADQGNTSLDVLMLRSKVDKNVYAATCINASQTISDDISVPTAAVQTVFIQMNGDGAITSPNDVNVLEVKYAQTSGGGGVNNVAQLYCIATGCTIDNILHVINGAGTVTNGVLIEGTLTTGISVAGTCTTGISIGAATTGISVAAATNVLVASAVGTGTDGWLLKAGATGAHLDAVAIGGAISLFVDCAATSGSNRTVYVESLTSAGGTQQNFGGRFTSGAKTGITVTAGAWNIGIQGKVVSAGTHATGTTSAAMLAQLNNGGTFEAGSALYGSWVDSQLAATPANGGAGGNFWMLGLTTAQTGACQPTAMIYAFGGAIAAFDFTSYGDVVWAASAGTLTTAAGYIKCTIAGATRYIPTYTTIA